MMPLLAVLLAYLLGSIPFGYLLVRWTSGKDVRSLGSGNIGATNVLRTTGRRMGLLVLLLDMVKGFAAVWLAAQLTQHSPLWMSVSALAVMLGHTYPVFLKFKGGKAVASFVGAFAYLTPLPLFATLLLFVLMVATTHYLSMGSIVGALCFPLAVFLIDHPVWPVLVASLIAGGLIVWRHRANIERIRAGTEHVFTLRRRKA